MLELAHQGRALIGGQVALYAFSVPISINIAHGSRSWTVPVFLTFGAIALLIGAIFLAATFRRLTHLIEQHRETALDAGTSGSNA